MGLTVFVSIMAAAAEAGADAANPLPQLDTSTWASQLFWLAVTFGVLYFLMAGRFLPAIGGAIEERRDRIADDLDQASEFRQQAEDAEQNYQQALSDAKAKAQGIAAHTRADVDTEIADLQAETDKKLASQLEAAEARIAAMTSEAAAKVEEAATETARAIVETLIDEAPTDDALARAAAKVAS